MGMRRNLDEFRERIVSRLGGPIFTDELLLVKQEDGYLTEQGFAEIRQFIWEKFHINMPSDSQWKKWMHTSGDYKGTLPKRIGKYVRERTGNKVDPSDLSEIGNLARRHVQEEELYIDFSRQFKWQAGDFSDNGSCFWGQNSHAKALIQDAGGFAIRFWRKWDGVYWTEIDAYNQDGSLDEHALEQLRTMYGKDIYSFHVSKERRYYEGVGRCWVIPCYDGYVAFNGYGVKAQDGARVLGILFNMQYRACELVNWGTDSGLLYINSGRGWYIGNREVNYIDLEIGEQEEGYCDMCEQYCCANDLHYVDGYGSLCIPCLDSHFRDCYICGHTIHEDDLYFVSCGDCEELVCHACRQNECYRCTGCGNWFHHDDIKHIHESTWCEECAVA